MTPELHPEPRVKRRAADSAARARIGLTSPRRNTRGFSILVLMVALALLTAFALVSSRLINTTLRVHYDAGRVATEGRLLDAAVEQLRRDVWAARQVKVIDPRTIEIEMAGGGAVVWAVDRAQTLYRAERAPRDPPIVPGDGPPAGAPRWPAVGQRVSFEWDGPALTVRGADQGADRAGGLRLASQLQLAQAPHAQAPQPGGTR